jgi:predicted dinucleotide-binding enzyme
MKIGIIGTGHMGSTLGRAWTAAGHAVLFGSRDRSKASVVAAHSGGGAQAGDFDAAASFGDVVLYTVRGVFPSALLRAPEALAGKIVIDCNNRDIGDDSRPGEFHFDTPPPIPSLSERLAADVPAAHVVKAFNTIPQPVLEMEYAQRAPRHISVFLAADDTRAKGVVRGLVEDLGFVGVDSGVLANAWMLDGLADFLRLQIGVMGLGGFATISIDVVSES